MFGTFIGAYGLRRGVLVPESGPSKRWPWWVLLALGLYGATLAITLITLKLHPYRQSWSLAVNAGFAVSCAASSMDFLSILIRFLQFRVPSPDSLSENPYGTSIVPYGYVTGLH